VIVLIILLVWKWADNNDCNDDYEDCVFYCVWDISDCIIVNTQIANTLSYVEGFSALSCVDSLENCVEDCKK